MVYVMAFKRMQGSIEQHGKFGTGDGAVLLKIIEPPTVPYSRINFNTVPYGLVHRADPFYCIRNRERGIVSHRHLPACKCCQFSDK